MLTTRNEIHILRKHINGKTVLVLNKVDLIRLNSCIFKS